MANPIVYTMLMASYRLENPVYYDKRIAEEFLRIFIGSWGIVTQNLIVFDMSI